MKRLILTISFLLLNISTAQEVHLDSAWSMTIGGPNEEQAYDIQIDGPNGYIIAGFKATDGMSTEMDGYLLKINETGDTLWSKTYGSSSNDRFRSVDNTYDGGYIMTGWTLSPVNDYELWLLKTDSIGNVLWDSSYGGTNGGLGYCVQQVSGGYVVSGENYGDGGADAWLLKTDENGTLLWSQTYDLGVATMAYSFDKVGYPDYGYVLTGKVSGGAVENCFIIKIRSFLI